MSVRSLSASEEEEVVLSVLADRTLRTREVGTDLRHELQARFGDEWMYVHAAAVLERLVKVGKVERFKDPRWLREHCYRVAGKPAVSPSQATAHAPKGCICPPGANLTCQRWDCGRKTISVLGSSSFRITATGTQAFESGLNSKSKD